jgi:RNA polymerase sigma factor (sigma-70 family)
MATSPLKRAVERLRHAALARDEDGPSDAELLEAFVARRDEAAFAALVRRHGPMVLGVCRRVVGSPHDADDAFQATFLVLVRKASQIRHPDRLGPWLYGVATRVATKTRARSARHRHETTADICSHEHSNSDLLDVMPILDAELGRLPARHRDVLVLCLLNGATAEEAARQLHCPVGTVKSRLARARESLRVRLTSRGIAPAVAVAALASKDALALPVSQTLTRATLETIASPALAPDVVALTTGVIPSMLPKSLMMGSLLVGGLTVVGLGTAHWMKPIMAQGPPEVASGGGQAPGRDESINHMKQILLAFHNYYSTNDHLPPVAIYGADGLPKLSWRVAILPYLDENALYQAFRLDEPWDSPHNMALAARMPTVFQTPESPAPQGQTRIRGFAGRGALFEGARGIGLAEVTDGTSNTILLTKASEATLWTKPGELPFVEGQPLPALDDSDPQGYLLGVMDGSVRSLARSEALLLRPLITRAGGEIIIWPSVGGGANPSSPANTTLAPTGPNTSTTPPISTPMAMVGGMRADGMAGIMGGMTAEPTPRAIEQRLQRLEDKLDRLLKRLDAALPGNAHPNR